MKTEMHRFKKGELHSGSAKGPIVKNRKQAIAIALNEAGMSNKGKKKSKKSSSAARDRRLEGKPL